MGALPRPIPRPQGNPNIDVGSFRGSGLIEDFLNSPNKVGAGVSEIAAGRYKQGIGRVTTGLVEGPAGFIPVGRVAQVGLKGGSKLLPRVVASTKFGAKQGAGFGAAYGAGSAASQNANYGDILKSAAVGGGMGLVGGAGLGTALPVAGAGVRRFLTANQIGAVGKNVKKPNVSKALQNKIQNLETLRYGNPSDETIARALEKAKAQVTPTPQVGKDVNNVAKSVPTPKGVKTKVSLNTKKLNLNAAQQSKLTKATTEDIPKLTNEQVREAAKLEGLDTTKLTPAQSKRIIAAELNARNKVSQLSKEHEQLKRSGAPQKDLADSYLKVVEAGRTTRAQGTHAARSLNARRIVADGTRTPEQRVLNLLDLAGVNANRVAKRFAKVDFSNPKQVFSAYRDLVPSRAEEWLDKFRYTNMLSSPLTHIVNLSANLGSSTVMAPLRKAVEGGIDFARAGVTRGPRTRFAGEAGAYYKGVAHAFGDAKKAFSDVITGRAALTQPDIVSGVKNPQASSFNIPLATKGVAGIADKVLTIIPRAMDASDKFFMALVRGGEKSAMGLRQNKGVAVGNIDRIAEEAALYNMWRRPLGIKEQGQVLRAIDWLPKTVGNARNSDIIPIRVGAKLTFPFIITPTNLFKQGIEFSPTGLTTFWGNADKTAQAAKMFIGTGIVATASGILAAGGNLSFSEPSNPKERDADRAEGKQPYAIKIGNRWFGYSKLHPAISFNLATMAAVKSALDKGTIDQDGADKMMGIFGGMVGFMRDQSYMRAVGDITNALQSRDGSSFGDAVAAQSGNTINQVFPFKSMVAWIGRWADPTQRKVDYSANVFEQTYQSVIKDVPWLNKAVSPRVSPYTGQPIKTDNPILNALSPSRVTNDRGYGNTSGMNVDQRQVMNNLMAGDERAAFRENIMLQKGKERIAQRQKDQLQKGTGTPGAVGSGKTTGGITELANGKFYAKVGDEYVTKSSRKDAQLAIDKNTFKESGKDSMMIGETYHFKDENGEPRSKPRYKYDFDVSDSQNQLDMTIHKENGDIQSWYSSAEKQIKALTTLRDKYNQDSQPDKVDDTQKRTRWTSTLGTVDLLRAKLDVRFPSALRPPV